MMCGVCPIPASSGKTQRHRLNRGGNRQANSALHMVVVCRMRTDERTRAYVARRTLEGLSQTRDHALPEALRGPRDLPRPHGPIECLTNMRASEIPGSMIPYQNHLSRQGYARLRSTCTLTAAYSLTVDPAHMPMPLQRTVPTAAWCSEPATTTFAPYKPITTLSRICETSTISRSFSCANRHPTYSRRRDASPAVTPQKASCELLPTTALLTTARARDRFRFPITHCARPSQTEAPRP